MPEQLPIRYRETWLVRAASRSAVVLADSWDEAREIAVAALRIAPRRGCHAVRVAEVRHMGFDDEDARAVGGVGCGA